MEDDFKPRPQPVTNSDLYDRLNVLEHKMNILMQKMEQATGAWTFIKILGSLALGIAVIWNSIASYLKL